MVAAASGMGVILALSKGGVNAIVGTSISASLLPPCVNTGICTAYVMCLYFFSDDWSDMSRYKQTAVVSDVWGGGGGMLCMPLPLANLYCLGSPR